MELRAEAEALVGLWLWHWFYCVGSPSWTPRAYAAFSPEASFSPPTTPPFPRHLHIIILFDSNKPNTQTTNTTKPSKWSKQVSNVCHVPSADAILFISTCFWTWGRVAEDYWSCAGLSEFFSCVNRNLDGTNRAIDHLHASERSPQKPYPSNQSHCTPPCCQSQGQVP